MSGGYFYLRVSVRPLILALIEDEHLSVSEARRKLIDGELREPVCCDIFTQLPLVPEATYGAVYLVESLYFKQLVTMYFSIAPSIACDKIRCKQIA